MGTFPPPLDEPPLELLEPPLEPPLEDPLLLELPPELLLEPPELLPELLLDPLELPELDELPPSLPFPGSVAVTPPQAHRPVMATMPTSPRRMLDLMGTPCKQLGCRRNARHFTRSRAPECAAATQPIMA